MRKTKKYEPLVELIFRISSVMTIVAVGFIVLFIISKGVQPFLSSNKEGTYSFVKFISGLEWRPNDDINKAQYGILYMIVGSLFATGGAIILGVPISIFAAGYLSELANEKVKKIAKAGIMLLAGIPSVIYGVFGLGFIVPKIKEISPMPQGQSLLAVIIVLTMMILPTMIVIAENAIASVPSAYRNASYALGASKVYTTIHVIIPAARRGILVGVILGVGRAIGEAMAVVLIAGNVSGGIPTSLFEPIRPLTANVVLEMSYATGLHSEMLFATGSILMLFIIGINLVLSRIIKRMGKY
ncbi:MAG: phosphate ABC transporter permease subunit PstC [Clostridia bacterium]|nr:phosphate ABC transporter permease subunit PstC [Clostridia bacterium]